MVLKPENLNPIEGMVLALAESTVRKMMNSVKKRVTNEEVSHVIATFLVAYAGEMTVTAGERSMQLLSIIAESIPKKDEVVLSAVDVEALLAEMDRPPDERTPLFDRSRRHVTEELVVREATDADENEA